MERKNVLKEREMLMGTIIAIGGMKNKIEEVKNICEIIIRKSKKEKPKLLYIPTANNDHKEYSEYMARFFEGNFSCDVDILWLINKSLSLDEIEDKISNTDIVFAEGGNLLTLLQTWTKYCVDRMLKQAYENGTIMSGISAGANCWFEQSFSDSVGGKEYTFVKGLGFAKGCICPHYNNERRKRCFNYEINNRNDLPNIALGIEENSAIVIEDNKIQIVPEENSNNGVYIMRKNKEQK